MPSIPDRPSMDPAVVERMTSPILDSPWAINPDGTIFWVKSLPVKRKIEILSGHVGLEAVFASGVFWPEIRLREPPSPVFRVERGEIVWIDPRTPESKLAILERLAVSKRHALKPHIGPETRLK